MVKNSGNNFATRVQALRPEGAYAVLSRAQKLEAQGREILHFEIGEPFEDTPASIKEAAISAIRANKTKYTPSAGMDGLREKIAQHAGSFRNIEVDVEEVLIAPGGKPSLFFPTLALIEPGDEVILPDPGFPTYDAMVQVAQGTPIHVPLLEEKGFSYDLDALSGVITPKTKMIVLNFPGNPTGGIASDRDLRHIAELARVHNLWVISDEIYSRILYEEQPFQSISGLPGMKERTIIVDGFSKTYSMTGWRLGYGIMPKPLARKVSLLYTHAFGCTAHFTQIAGMSALDLADDYYTERAEIYRKRRDLMVKGLNELPGFSCFYPAGGFYAFPNIRNTGYPSDVLADVLLNQAGVSTLPGTAFGQNGKGYLRLCFATSPVIIEKGLERMLSVLQKLSWV